MSQSAGFGEGRKVPGFAKGVIILQMLVIAFLSSWIVEEYLNNIYLQAYVSGTFQAYEVLIIAALAVSSLGVVFGLMKARSGHKQDSWPMSQPEIDGPVISSLDIGSEGSRATRSGPRPSGDMHPMVAALKADLAHQNTMQPLPSAEPSETAPQAPVLDTRDSPYQNVPSPPPAKTLTGIPSTVITGTMPVLKKVRPDDENQGAGQ